MLDLSRVWPELKAVEKIGEGSFGKVYKCESEEFGIKSVCAVKVISIPQSSSVLKDECFDGFSDEQIRNSLKEFVDDFEKEIKLMKTLKGAPNVVAVEDYKITERTNETGWDIYIRTEYLEQFYSAFRNKPVTETDVKVLVSDICNALDICAKNGIIHSDIKPDNIFVDRFGSYKLGDFGMAKRFESLPYASGGMGARAYIAPEILRGEAYNCRSDIFSLGRIAYKLLNRNRDPFVNMDSDIVSFRERSDAMARIFKGDKMPAPVDASPEMAAVILKACEFRPENRFASAAEFRASIFGANVVASSPVVGVEEEATVAARDNELPAPAVFQAGLDDATVAADETPLKYVEETTALSDENGYDAVAADDAAELNDKSKRKTREKKSEKQKKIKEPKTKKNRAEKAVRQKDKKPKEKKQRVKKTKEKEPVSPSQKFVNGIEIKYFIVAFLMGAFLIAGLGVGTLICYELYYNLSHIYNYYYHNSDWFYYYFNLFEYGVTIILNAAFLVLNVVSLYAYGVHKKKPVALIIGAVETTLLFSFNPTLFLCLLPVPLLLITPLSVWTWIEQRKMSEAEFNQHNHCLFKPKFMFITNYVLFALIIACAILNVFIEDCEVIILIALCLCVALSVAAIVLNSLTQLKNPKLNVALKIVSITNLFVSFFPICIYALDLSSVGVIASIALSALSLVQTLLTVYTDYKKLTYTK